MAKPATVFIADDHVILREALSQLISGFPDFCVCGLAGNGHEVLRKFRNGNIPDVLLLDIRMPLLDGTETARLVREEFPSVRIIALTMFQEDHYVLRMIRNGASAFLRKDAAPAELLAAIRQVLSGSFYHNELVSSAMLKNVVHEPGVGLAGGQLNDRHKEFLRLASTELTYKEVADRMRVSVRTVDGYRDELFHRLKVKSRVGLVRYAICHQLVEWCDTGKP